MTTSAFHKPAIQALPIPALTLRRSTLLSLPILALFTWYVLYPGLVTLSPAYDRIDDLLLFLILVISIVVTVVKRKSAPVAPVILLTLLLYNVLLICSALLHETSPSMFIQYAYRVNRPWILLYYIAACALPVEKIFGQMVLLARILLLYNLPSLLYQLAVVNVKILQDEYNDAIHGFFPFQNNDSIALLLLLSLLADVHAVFIRRQAKRSYWFAAQYILLLCTMNFKVIILTTLGIGLIIFLRSHNKLRNATVFLLLSFVPLMVISPIIRLRIDNIITSPVYIASQKIISGKVTEYSWLVGTGPGNFTSPEAYDRESTLNVKYGLYALRHYWEKEYTGPTGTLTSWTSSFLTLFGDVGALAVITLVSAFLWLMWRNLRYIRFSPLCLSSFVFGLYLLPAGIFLDSWFWGVEVLLLMLSARVRPPIYESTV